MDELDKLIEGNIKDFFRPWKPVVGQISHDCDLASHDKWEVMQRSCSKYREKWDIMKPQTRRMQILGLLKTICESKADIARYKIEFSCLSNSQWKCQQNRRCLEVLEKKIQEVATKLASSESMLAEDQVRLKKLLSKKRLREQEQLRELVFRKRTVWKILRQCYDFSVKEANEWWEKNKSNPGVKAKHWVDTKNNTYVKCLSSAISKCKGDKECERRINLEIKEWKERNVRGY